MRDAARLELVEEGAYRRLIDAYYVAEGPLPADRRECYKLAGAVKTAERKAVDYVLGKFFDETPDGFRHKRCELEIARFRDKQNKAKASAESRWNAKRTESGRNANASPTEQPDAMRTHSEGNAHQTPDTRHQSPDIKATSRETPSIGQNAEIVSPSPGEVCKAMRDAGISKVNPANPRLHRLIADGATLAEFVDAVPGSLSAQSPFGYALGTVEGRRKEATTRANGGGSARDIDRADTLHTLTGGLISDQATKTRKDANHGRTIDGEAKRVD